MEQIKLADFMRKTEQEQISFDFRATTMDFKKSDELGKFLEYKRSKGTDTDRCPLIWEVYQGLWDIEDEERSGDTMNSVQKTLNKYFRIKGKSQVLKDSQSEFENILSKDAEEFLSVAFTIGNFIPIPAKTANHQSFNTKRNSCYAWDYWDRTLYCIYQWYKAAPKQKEQWLEKLLCGKVKSRDCIVVACEDWLKSFQDEDKQPSWDIFIEDNFLQDYTEWTTRPYGRPKEFWDGHFSEKVLPQTPEQVEAFFARAAECIKTRSKRMVDKLRDRSKSQQKE